MEDLEMRREMLNLLSEQLCFRSLARYDRNIAESIIFLLSVLPLPETNCS